MAEVLAHIRQDPILSEPVHRQALALAEPLDRDGIHRSRSASSNRCMTGRCCGRMLLESLRSDASIAEPVRLEALAFAEHTPGKSGTTRCGQLGRGK